MDSSLDSIWDEPAIENSPKRTQPAPDEDDDIPMDRPTKRSKTALFFSDSEDDDLPGPSRPTATHIAPPPQDIDIEGMFADLDDDNLSIGIPARIDEEAVAREAEARYRQNMPPLTLHEIMPSSSPPRDLEDSTTGKNSKRNDNDEVKARRRAFKLDENRLLGPSGFPRLIQMTKGFKIKGKGHEATDLNRILQTYQYWTHELYPKTQFRDTVERVEKLSHSRRMNVALSVWRDEAHGVPTRQKDTDDEDEDAEDLNNADHPNDAQMDTDDHLSRPRSSSSMPSSRASSPPLTSGAEDHVPLRPRLEEAQKPSSQNEDDDEEAFWRSLDEFGDGLTSAHAPPSLPAAKTTTTVDDDDEMWDIIDELQRESTTNPSAPIAGSTTAAPQAPSAVNEPEPDDWDEMYI